MPGLLPHVDPDGLLEFSVVYTDRSLNHMSKSFMGVINDISSILKEVYHAKSAVVVPGSGTYSIWINGNIPNGIITYTATAVVTNTNVPVLGDQYGWYYVIGNALVLTSLPNQFTGTAGSISNVNTYLGNTANVFTFGITNNSGGSCTIQYGYIQIG